MYTPGPWKVISRKVIYGKCYSISFFIGKDDLPPSATGFAQFDVQPYSRPAEAEANARLIAAAPDLLAALQGLRTALGRWQKGAMNSEECQLAEVAADTAIAKATA